MAEQKDNGFDFAIPGEEEEPQQGSLDDPVKRSADKPDISLFWLLQHYNKDNAAVYKLQREKKKADKKEKKALKKAKGNGETQTATPDDHGGNAPVKTGGNGGRITDDFGSTVFIKRDHRPGLTNVPVLPAAALECLGFGETVPLNKVPFVIGRSSHGVDLCIADNILVGRMHAAITFRAGSFYITDLKSLNHVYLDDVQIQPEVETQLNHLAKITLGNEEFIFHRKDG